MQAKVQRDASSNSLLTWIFSVHRVTRPFSSSSVPTCRQSCEPINFYAWGLWCLFIFSTQDSFQWS